MCGRRARGTNVCDQSSEDERLSSNGLYRSRTDTPLRAVDFESTASANSAKRPGEIFGAEGYATFDGAAIARRLLSVDGHATHF
jgi:hypothetical protein